MALVEAPTKLCYRIEELVAATGIPRTTIYEHIRAGRLKVWHLGARTMISADAARDWIDGLVAEAQA